ncbi:MAG: radical SAM protein [Elusimicrobia bacterium]|nr:radical SAM protein [Elusimicrobiota bacterium]
MHRADLKIGFNCNNHCVFCVQGKKREKFAPRTLPEIKKNLKDGLERGARGLVMTGGEPAIHEHFLETIRIAGRMGYSVIQVQTNGRMFCYPDFCRKVLEAGATEFSPALHGSTAPLHDYLVGASGAFLQTVAGIVNLRKLGARILTNSVITRANYRDLPDLAGLLVRLGVDQYQFAFVHIAGTAAENRSWLVARKSMAEPWVKKGLDVGIRAGKVVMTEAIPFCFMRGYERYVAEQIIPETVVYDAEITIADYTKSRRDEGKGKGPRCGECSYCERCEGPWKEYPELYGWDEFEPVKERSKAVKKLRA